jgi:hypothetical protein
MFFSFPSLLYNLFFAGINNLGLFYYIFYKPVAQGGRHNGSTWEMCPVYTAPYINRRMDKQIVLLFFQWNLFYNKWEQTPNTFSNMNKF